MADFDYDDTQLQRLFAELEPKRRKQALRSSMRKTANTVRKRAVQNLRATGINVNKDMEKAIRAVVFKKTAGFRVTIGSKRKTKQKPAGSKTLKPWNMIDIWLEQGTPERHTRSGGVRRTFLKRLRKGHRTGRIAQRSFMTETLKDVKDSVTREMKDNLRSEVVRISKKYGCRE